MGGALHVQNQSGSWHRDHLRPSRKPDPGPPGVGLRCAPRARKYRRAARLGCSGARWPPGVRQQQPRALLEDTGLQSRDQQPTGPPRHPPQTHTHVQTVRNLPPVLQVQSSLLKAPTANLAGPVATPAPYGVICILQPAWIKQSKHDARSTSHLTR
jgi:hypothetical protein